MKSRTAELPPTPAEQIKRDERKLAEVRRIVCDFWQLPRSAMTSRDRAEPLATRRQVAMMLCRESVGVPFQTIAFSFARSDHQTVAHACEAVPDKMQTDEALRCAVEFLRGKVTRALDSV